MPLLNYAKRRTFFIKTPDEIKAILQVMREFGVESFELDSLKVSFGDPRIAPIINEESPKDRLERMKRDLKAAQVSEAEILDWST